MKILAIEFSSAQKSAALVENSKALDSVREWEVVETVAGSFKPFELIEQALHLAGAEREQVDCLALGIGPGSYNGIRAAIALAQGWQLGRQVRLQALSSAECLAAQAHAQGISGRVAIIIDAQRNELYLANYELSADGWRELKPLRLASLAEAGECEKAGELLIGPEVTKWFSQGRIIFPRAAMLGRLALDRTAYLHGEQLEPIYLRATSFVKAQPPRVLPE